MSAYSRPYSATKSSAAARASGASRQGEKLKHEKIGVVPFSALQMDGPPGFTNLVYWDEMAQDYDGEIMSSFDEDVNKVIRRRVNDHCRGAAASFALDLGCGVGKYLPLLAQRCRSVLGVDISGQLLRQAGQLCSAYSNVSLRQVDLANYKVNAHLTGDLPRGEATFLVCANAIISPDPTVCSRIFDTVKKCLAPGGKLLLVIPSTESAQLGASLIGEWRDAQRQRFAAALEKKGGGSKKGGSRAKTPVKLEEEEVTSPQDVAQGVYCRDGVRTKTFLQAQVQEELFARGLSVLSADKVEYRWDTEYRGDGSQNWMPACGLRPWDWLFIAENEGGGSGGASPSASPRASASTTDVRRGARANDSRCSSTSTSGGGGGGSRFHDHRFGGFALPRTAAARPVQVATTSILRVKPSRPKVVPPPGEMAEEARATVASWLASSPYNSSSSSSKDQQDAAASAPTATTTAKAATVQPEMEKPSFPATPTPASVSGPGPETESRTETETPEGTAMVAAMTGAAQEQTTGDDDDDTRVQEWLRSIRNGDI